MVPIGGICGVLMGQLNHWEKTKNMPVIVQALIATFIICLPIEFIFGLVLNVWLNLGLWDYTLINVHLAPGNSFSFSPLNIMGQISILSAGVFFIIYPFAYWFDDILRYLLFREGKPYHLLIPYKEMFTFKTKTCV
jgi:hypothetical protein